MNKCCAKSAALAKIETWEEAARWHDSASEHSRRMGRRESKIAHAQSADEFRAKAAALRSSLEAKDGGEVKP